MKKSNKILILTAFVLVFTFSSIALPINNVIADQMQDDGDLEVTLHGKMYSDSSELVSSLMPLGSYDFFDQPELDITNSEIDLFKNEFSEIQIAESSQTDPSLSQITPINATEGNKTLTNELPQYTVGAGFDSILQSNIDFNASTPANETELYVDDFSESEWELINTSDTEISQKLTGVADSYNSNDDLEDTYIDEDDPDANWVFENRAKFEEHPDYDDAYDYRAFIRVNPPDYLISKDDYRTFHFKISGCHMGSYAFIYKVEEFNPSTITWNNFEGIRESDKIDQTDNTLSTANWFGLNLSSDTYKHFEVATDVDYSNSFYTTDNRDYEGNLEDNPYVWNYMNKFHQEDNLLYFQTDTNEKLTMRGDQFTERTIYPNEYFKINTKTNTDSRINLTLRNDGSKVKSFEVIPSGNSETGNQSINITMDEQLTFDQYQFESDKNLDDKDYFKVYNISMMGHSNNKFFDKAYIKNFTYRMSGSEYKENVTLSFDGANSDYEWNNGHYLFYFSISELENRDSNFDINITNQNVTALFHFQEEVKYANLSLSFNYSANEYVVPTEADFELNGEDVIDESLNEGILNFADFQSKLNFTATRNLYFNLNITIDFTFKFNLNVESKTYLHRKFKLVSDHNIYFERIDISAALDVKGLYLNNEEYSVDDDGKVIISPEYEMPSGKIYSLEIILADELYLPLTHIYNTLGSGTSQLLLKGTTNTIEFSNINQYNDLDVDLLANYQAQTMNLSFSNLDYTPPYTSNSSNNIYGSGGGSSSWNSENVDYSQDYYQTETEGRKVGESGGSGYEDVYSQDFSSETGDMSHDYYPDSYNSSYNYDSNEMFMENQFPQEYQEKKNFEELEDSKDLSGDDDFYGITYNGSSFFVVGNLGYQIYQYSSNFTLENTYDIYTMGGNSQARGITYNGSSFFVTDHSDDMVYQYSSNFNALENTYDIGAMGGNDAPYGIAYNGSSFFVTDYDSYVYQYSSDFNVLENTYDIGAMGDNNNPYGIVYVNDANAFFVTNEFGSVVYQYSPDFSLLQSTYDIGAIGGNNDPWGLIYNEGYFFVVDNTDAKIYQYSSEFMYLQSNLESGNSSVNPPQYIRGPTHGEGEYAFAGATTSDDRVVFAPSVSNRIGIYNPSTDTYTQGPEHGEGDWAFWGATTLSDDRVVFSPYDSDYIGIYDPSDNTYTQGPEHGEGNNAFWGATTLSDDRVVFSPCDSDYIGIYDPSDNTYTSGPTHGEGSSAFIEAATLSDDRVVFSSFNSEHVGIYDPSDNTYTSGPTHGEGGAAFWGATTLSDDRVVFGPYDSNYVGIYDPSTDTYTQGPEHGEGNKAFSGATTLSDDRVVFGPYDSNYVGIYDPSTDTYTQGPEHGEGNKAFSGATTLSDDRVVFAPYKSDYVGIYIPIQITNGTLNSTGDLSSVDGDTTTINSTEAGHYPATYSFGTGGNEDSSDSVGDSGTDIEFVDVATVYDGGLEIIDKIDGHRNVLRFQDDETAGENPWIKHNIIQATSGTREFYIASNDFSNSDYLFSFKEGSTRIAALLIGNSELSYNDGSWHVIQSISDDTLYKIKVKWYADNTYDVWVNDSLEADGVSTVNNQTSGINRLKILLTTDTSDYVYIDAWGDPDNDADYSIGDNYHWQHYKGTDDFESYNISDDAESELESNGWDVTADANCSAGISGEFGKHKKYLNLTDESVSGDIHIYQDISESTSGAFEYYFRTDTITSSWRGQFVLQDGGKQEGILNIAADGTGGWIWKWWNGSTNTNIGIPVEANKWYHVKIKFDISVNDVDIYINETEHYDTSFDTAPTHISRIKIKGNGGSTYTELYDSLGIVGVNDYEEGDNLECNEMPTLDATYTTQVGTEYDTIEYLDFLYSYKTDIPQEINMSVWNWNNENWVLVNSSVNNQSFYSQNEDELNLDNIINVDKNIKVRYYGLNISNEFQLFIDQLKYEYNWTQTRGDLYNAISQTYDYDFLNRYDTYSDYLDLYNISSEFQYRFLQDINYTEQGNWDYPATYSFGPKGNLDSGDEVGDYSGNETELELIDDHFDWGEDSGITEIVDKKQGHRNVLYIGNYSQPKNYFDNQQNGTVECYTLWEGGTPDIQVFGNSNGLFFIKLYEDKVRFYVGDGSGGVKVITESYTAGNWVHIRFDFNCSTDKIDAWLDGNKVVDGENFRDDKDSDYVDEIRFTAYLNEYAYYDAIGYSWDPDYSVGDNLEPLPIFGEMDENEIDLEMDGNWHTATSNFEFNSGSVDSFNTLFNVSNGLLEIKNMNYTLKFKALDTSDRVALGQYYSFDLPINLDYLQQTRGNFILNYSLNFNATEDGFYDFYNQVNNSYLLIRIGATHEDGSNYIYNYNTNTSFSQDFSINITDYFNSLGKSNLKDLVFKIAMCGNPSNLSLDDMTLYDYDDEFYKVDFVNITDSVVISHQDITIAWKASDRYISNVEINQTFISENMIYNVTLLNNTEQSVEFNNITTGFYNHNLTFYDDYGNWERWNVNFTIFATTSISTSYKNPVFINENNTVSVYIESEYSLFDIWYDNSSEYIQEYANSSYPQYTYEFNFSLSYSAARTYNISIKVFSEYNDTFYVNITGLSFIKRATSLNLDGLKTNYEQSDTLKMTITLADSFNNVLNNENIHYTLVAPNNTEILDTSDTTNTTGEINLAINFSPGYEPGFYHLNFSFESTNAYHYCYKLDSFEITPISRSVNSSEINLTVNDHNVTDNFIQINYTSDLNITHLDNATFDMSAVLLLNYTENINYTEYFSYSFTFQPSTDVTYFDIASANITNVPVNFTNYYYNDLATSNYNLTNSNLQINDLLGNVLQDESSFKVGLGYFEDQYQRTQISKHPTTNDKTVEFSEIMNANRSFSYWYFQNELDINSITLKHIRSGDTINSFDINNSKYYFEKACQKDDLFNATIKYNTNWNIKYEIEVNNGTYSKIKIDYSADLNIENVDLILDLSSSDLYNDNWTMNASQSSTNFKLTIPNINFTASEQTMYIEGFSSIPYANITEYESDQNWNRIAVDSDPIDYAGFLEYPKFSKIFYTIKETDWNVYNVHYGDEKYNAKSLSDRLAKFEGAGFDPGVTDSYIHFRTNPFKKVDWNWNKDTDNITITINSSLAVEKAFFQVQFNPSQAHSLELVSNNTNVFGLSDSGDYEGYLFFYVNELPAGETIIKIHINYVEPIEMLIQGLPLIGVTAALIGVYYYIKKDEERVEEIGEYVSERLKPFIDKLRKDEADWDEIQEFRIKDGKIEAKIEKK